MCKSKLLSCDVLKFVMVASEVRSYQHTALTSSETVMAVWQPG